MPIPHPGLRLSLLLSILLLLISPGSLCLAEPPVITSIYPNLGPRTSRTPVTIRGENLGESIDDIIEITVGGTSCLETLMFDNPTSVGCIAYREGTNSAGTNVTEAGIIGPVSITTLTGGQSNQNLSYLFYNSCFMLATSSECINAGRYGQCKWCVHATRCLQVEEDCHEGCSSPSFKMTCGELAGIIVASFFLLLLLVSSVAFVVVSNQLKPKPKDPAPSLHSRKDSPIPDVASGRWSRASRSIQERPGNVTAGEEEEEDDDDEDSSPLLSEKFIRHQIAIESTHRKMAGNKSALTSFY